MVSFTDFKQAIPLISLISSFCTSSFGMSKFFLSGPIQLLPKNYPLNGLVSLPFVCMLLINCMFGARLICIENAFCTSYIIQTGDTYYFDTGRSIDPIIPPEYRILAYLTPSAISFIINMIRLLTTSAKIKKYVQKTTSDSSF